jgi:hypothetical protein
LKVTVSQLNLIVLVSRILASDTLERGPFLRGESNPRRSIGLFCSNIGGDFSFTIKVTGQSKSHQEWVVKMKKALADFKFCAVS